MSRCPACNNAGDLKVRCDTCGCCFCAHGACTGTVGGLKQVGNGRSAGSTCKCCAKGKLQKI